LLVEGLDPVAHEKSIVGPTEKRHRLPLEDYRGERCVDFTLCAQGRRPILASQSVVDGLLPILGASLEHERCENLIYCFMPDHLHLVVQGTVPRAHCYRAIVRFKQRSGFWLSQSGLGKWQKDFYDRILREGQINWRQRYVADNPVRAGLVADPLEYPYLGSLHYDLRQILLWLP
jgi:putative transposase